MAVPALMDKAIVRHVIKSQQDRGIAKNLLTVNKQLADIMPINSAVVEIIGVTNFVDDNIQRGQIVACIPLLSSHISMPLKCGEAVWLISFEEKNSQTFNYFWISRVHGSTETEDTNFTAPIRLNTARPRGSNRAFAKSQFINQSYNSADFPRFDNFIQMPDETRYFILQSFSNQEKEIERLVRKNNIVLEPVPRYFKNEDELVLQGSNNTLIAFKTFDGYNSNSNINSEQNIFYSNLSKANSSNDGFIDIVVGRSRNNDIPESSDFFNINDSNRFQETYTTSSFRTCYPTIANSLGRFENNKNFENFTETTLQNNNEGRPDFKHDAARICLSENRNIDSAFNIRESIYSNFNIQIPQDINLSTVVAKSDNIRIIARHNVLNNNNILENSKSSVIILKEGTKSQSFLDRGTQSFAAFDGIGNVVVDGSKIILGDENRASENHGEGNQLFLGQDNENAQPMVLGENLKNTLDNLCQQFINFIEIFNNHGHASTSAIGSAANPSQVGEVANITTDVVEEISQIKNNLITIQSKMGKLQ
tara:strand:+ start:3123 stop:4730 length:1608 start_codon:yes stop_codon:yes gene_type:complete